MSSDVIDEQILSFVTCQICREVIEKATTLICCSSSFCEKCIKAYLQLKDQCPICNMAANISYSGGVLKRDKFLQNIIHNILPQKKLSTTAEDSEFSDEYERFETYRLFIKPCENAEHFIKGEMYEEVTAKFQPFFITVNVNASIQSLESLIKLKYSRNRNKENCLQVNLYHNGKKLRPSRTLNEVFKSTAEKIKMVKFTAIQLKKTNNYVGIFHEFLLEKNNLKEVKQSRELGKRNYNFSRKKLTNISKMAKVKTSSLKNDNKKASYLVDQFGYLEKTFKQPIDGNRSNETTADENLFLTSVESNKSSLISTDQKNFATLHGKAATSSITAEKSTTYLPTNHQTYIKHSFGNRYSQLQGDKSVKNVPLQHQGVKYNSCGISLGASNIGSCTSLVNPSVEESELVVPETINRRTTCSNQMIFNYQHQSLPQFAAFNHLSAPKLSAPFSTLNTYSNVQNTIALQLENYHLKYQIGALYNQLLLSSQKQANQQFVSHHPFGRNQINTIPQATNAGLSGKNYFEITHQEDCDNKSSDEMDVHF